MGKRIEAAKAGQATYRGSRCPAGHPGVRYVSNGQCAACVKAGNRVYAARIRELRAVAIMAARPESMKPMLSTEL